MSTVPSDVIEPVWSKVRSCRRHPQPGLDLDRGADFTLIGTEERFFGAGGFDGSHDDR